MATIKEMLGPDAAEELRMKVLVGTDPMRLNRTRFEAYLKARSELVFDALTEGLGIETESALEVIRVQVYDLDAAWREEAKRINLAKRS
jgi:hypothetical protein